MRVFVSWSGELSHEVALTLRGWLPNVLQAVELYVSSEDVTKGARWFADVSGELERASFGIICLTRQSLSAPWVLFEAGALAKSIAQSRVTPLLIDLTAAEVQGPLAQFQSTATNEADVRRLVKAINAHSGETQLKDAQVEAAFAKWWPDLAQSLEVAVQEQRNDGDAQPKPRSEQDILEEVLQLTRGIARAVNKAQPEVEIVGRAAFANNTLESIQVALDAGRKPFLAIAVGQAHAIRVEADQLILSYEADRKRFAETVASPHNSSLLRDVCRDVIGRDIHVIVELV